MATRQSRERVDPVSKPTGRFSGAQDIVVVQQGDGKIRSTPWRFHKKWRLRGKEETSVKISVNDKTFDDIEISRKNCKKDGSRTVSYTPTTDNLRQIFGVLKEGWNKILFFSNESEVSARIYRLPPESKLIVTDIDKTLTKSVILGFSSLFKSKPKLHEATAALFSVLKGNGYIIIYVTARPITWWWATHRLISNHALNKDGAELPDGPLFCSKAGLIETIIKGHFWNHDKVKIPILQELQALFCEGSLHAGFGDANSDRRSYDKMGIPYTRIFKVLKNGRVRMFDSNGKAGSDVSQKELVEILNGLGKIDQAHSEERPSSPRSKNCCSVPISRKKRSPSCHDMNEEEQSLLNQGEVPRKKWGSKSWSKKKLRCFKEKLRCFKEKLCCFKQ